MPFIHTIPEKFKNATLASYFGFVFEKDTGREITRYCDIMILKKLQF